MSRFLYLIFSFALFFGICLRAHDKAFTKPFAVVTVPKTGSHLLMKCLDLLQTRSADLLQRTIGRPDFNDFSIPSNLLEIDQKMDAVMKNNDLYIFTHAQLTYAIQRLVKRHPLTPVIVGIRDLRDVLVSQAFFRWDEIERNIGPSTIRQKVTYVLEQEDGGASGTIVVIKKHANEILRLFSQPNVLIVRFEDLVGSQGGGDDQSQREMILKIAHHIGIPLGEKKLNQIQTILFGKDDTEVPDYTFRSGQIGSWKEIFTNKQLKIFNKKFGKLQKAFGYSLD
jgi:hypothetical protein